MGDKEVTFNDIKKNTKSTSTLKATIKYLKEEIIIPALLKNPKYCHISQLKTIVKYVIGQIPTMSFLGAAVFSARKLNPEYFEDVCTLVQVVIINLRDFLHVLCRPNVKADEETKKIILGTYIDAVVTETKRIIRESKQGSGEFNKLVNDSEKIIQEAIDADIKSEKMAKERAEARSATRKRSRSGSNTVVEIGAGVGPLLPPGSGTVTRSRSRSSSTSKSRSRSGSKSSTGSETPAPAPAPAPASSSPTRSPSRSNSNSHKKRSRSKKSERVYKWSPNRNVPLHELEEIVNTPRQQAAKAVKAVKVAAAKAAQDEKNARLLNAYRAAKQGIEFAKTRRNTASRLRKEAIKRADEMNMYRRTYEPTVNVRLTANPEKPPAF